MQQEHQTQCSSSCYDCTRDFYNQQHHSTMHWRLGLDLAKIAHDPNQPIDFTAPYWHSHIQTITNRLKNPTKTNNTYIITHNNQKILITHPFWSTEYIQTLQTTHHFDKTLNIIKAEKLTKEI
ncbi:MAG: hypothetical protein LUG51_00045 [Tannerellaceae bacterium]|nr:hypothetical protein [Tannerellaceae bacterium]